MKQKIVLMVVLMMLLAGCAKLVEPGSTPRSIGAQPTATLIGTPRSTPFQSPLATPFQSPLATPNP